MKHPPPDEPPRRCPVCDADLSAHPYSRARPGPVAKRLRQAALALLPVMAVLYLVLLLGGRYALGFGTGHGYLAVALIGGPSLILYGVSRLLPPVRQVICLRCSWSRTYPPERSRPRVA